MTAALPDWGLPEWTVLAVLGEEQAHGFAIAALTAPGGAIGRVWYIPRPVVYRALGRIEDAGLVVPSAVESGPGPRRTVYALTDAGRIAAEEWLLKPVAHVRLLRSHLLMKLALLNRRGADVGELLRAQREVLDSILDGINAERAQQEGFDAVLLAWRHTTASAAVAFLDQIG